MFPFTWSDDELEEGARSFYGVTLTRDIGVLKRGESYPYAMAHVFGDYPVLRIYAGLPAVKGTQIHEFPLITVGG